MKNDQRLYANLKFAETWEEARERAQKFRYSDPLSDIPPALLNKTDIAKYVAETGMLFPFDPAKLKPASYEVELGDEALYWDEDGKQYHLENLKATNPVKIRQNSITFVGVKTKFQIPFYIALRFNLTITHVHRGLLLGTGPLIDPGFDGKIMIPLHNLTTNDYELRPGDDLIAVEFTKVSPDSLLKDNTSLENKEYGRNVKKPNLSFNNYVEAAIKPLNKVQSSLEQTIGKAKKQVDAAQDQMKEMRTESARTSRIITSASIFVAAALVITSLAVFFQTRSLIADANKYVSDSAILLTERSSKTSDLINEESLRNINVAIEEGSSHIDKIIFRLDQLENRMDLHLQNTEKKWKKFRPS